MPEQTRLVIAAAVGVIALLTAAVLWEMFGTVLFAITVAYVLVPVQDRFLERGWPRRRAAIATTLAAVGAALLVLAPIAYVAITKRGEVAALVAAVPETFTVAALGMSATLESAALVSVIVEYLPTILLSSAAFLSALSIKFALFGIVVFGLLVGHERAREAILAPVPPTYRPFLDALHERARNTLVALLVLQVGTALGTFALGVPTFWLLGYDGAVVLAAIAGVLQFLPIIGPIVLLLALAGFHVVAGEMVAAVLIVVVGGIVVGWLPDLLVRPRLARYTTGMSGTLYFVGFIGGIASLGIVGVLAGPLLVALLVEGVDRLAAEMPHTDAAPVTADVESSSTAE